MFYSMYLSSVCQRRSWPDPLYEPYRNQHGYYCKVRVNNREYCTDVPYETEAMARDGAAMKAYMICRNFSHNDGMFPGQRPGQASSTGIIQGLPVAIGKDRGSNRSSGSSYTVDGPISSDGTSSGGTSPKSVGSSFEQHLTQPTTYAVAPAPRRPRGPSTSKRSTGRSSQSSGYMCLCGGDQIARYGRCYACCRANGWM